MKPASILKWLGIALGVIALLFAALLAYIAFIFDANAYKGRITGFVADKYQRTLVIDGDLKLSVFPRIAIALPRTTLSDPNAKTVAAEVNAVRVSLELLPLLRREIRVGEVTLDGLKTSFVKSKDGKTNFDDLIGGGEKKPAESEAPAAAGTPAFDVGGIRITDSAVAYRDLAAPHDVALSKLDLKVGRLADKSAVPLELSVRIDGKQPAVAGLLTAKGKVLLDLGAKRYGAERLNAKFDGSFAGQPLNAQLDLASLDWTPAKFEAPSLKIALKRSGADAVDATVTLDGASGTPMAVNAKQLAVSAKLAGGARTIALDLKSPLAANIDALAVTLAALDGRVKVEDPALPVKVIDMPFTGRLAVDAKSEKVDGKLDTKFDESTIAAKFNVAGFAKPAIGFDLGIDRINLDRYMKPAPAAAGTSAAPGAVPAKEEPFDLSALKSLALDGAARIGSLQVRGIKASNVAVKLAAHGGDLRVAPMSAQLYGGALDASARVDANTNRFAFAPRLTNIQIGPLLKDAAKIDKLEGRGNVAADVNATGNTVTALKRSLGGNASVRLVDGAIIGFDYGKRLADWRTKLSSLAAAGQGGAVRNEGASSSANEKTTFSELSANFAIANGIATNNDLSVKAPLVRLAGAGTIDIGRDSLDYTVKASVVNTLTGQGGKSLGQAKDVTIPVRVHGPYDKTAYEIQWAAVTSSALKGAVGEKLDEKKQELEQKARDRLQDKLKGLLSR